MKVMVFVKASRESEAGEKPSRKLLEEMTAFNEALAEAGVMIEGEGLHPSVRGVRVHFDGEARTVSDGPFAELKEVVAGYWLWEVESMAEAIEWARKCPNPTGDSGQLELRPVFGPEDLGEDFTPELQERNEKIRARTPG